MVLWLALACVTAAALAVILRPLGAPLSPAGRDGAAEMAVYRDQLQEIEAERERGLLGEAEAKAARAEVARRLLASDEAAKTADDSRPMLAAASRPGADTALPGSSAPFTRLAIVVAAVVPLFALSLYLGIGSPGAPDQPVAARVAARPEASPLPALVATVEARLRQHPEDGPGWDVIAPVYLKTGRYGEAAQAYKRAAELLGQSFARLAGFAESTMLAANGIITEEARAAYQRLVEMAPTRHEPRFWLALAQEQDGNVAAAAAGYKALLDAAPADAPWRAMVKERLDGAMSRLPPGTTLPTTPALPPAAAPSATEPSPAPSTTPKEELGERGPTAGDMAAAAKLTEAERTAMIEQMVSGLAARLKTDGRDLRGWQRLIRAYVVLGRAGEARAALDQARSSLSDDAAAQTELGLLAKSLGLGT